MKRWEYRHAFATDGQERVLNELGVQGWELVSAWRGNLGVHFYLKREVNESSYRTPVTDR